MKHLGWPKLPQLVVRLKLVDVQLKNQRHLTRMYNCPASTTLLGDVEQFARVIKSRPGSSALETYLQDVWYAVEANNKVELSHAEPRRLGADLKLTLLSGPCSNCGAANKCAGEAGTAYQDDRNLHGFGNCITLLSDLFRAARDLSANFYLAHAGAQPANPGSFETGILDDDRARELCRAIDAEVRETEDEGPRVVRLLVHVEAFGLADYYSALYLLFHECFAHIACGIQLNSETADWSDRFHEGWMDEAGYFLLTQTLSNQKSPVLKAPQFAAHLDEFLQQAQSLHHRRIQFSGANPSPSAAQYADGAQAARRFRKICATWCGSETEGDGMFYRFSLSVNASDCGDHERALLVERLNELCEEHNVADLLIGCSMLTDALIAFSQGGDALMLLRSILSIHSPFEERRLYSTTLGNGVPHVRTK